MADSPKMFTYVVSWDQGGTGTVNKLVTVTSKCVVLEKAKQALHLQGDFHVEYFYAP